MKKRERQEIGGELETNRKKKREGKERNTNKSERDKR
jgi:hypothetical protein